MNAATQPVLHSYTATDQCEHDLVSVEDHNLPPYCWHYRCRKCGVECSNPSELVNAPDDTGGLL